jgi:hypothetical protein
VSDPQSAEEIQRQMAEIRCALHENVSGIVESARVMTDWRYYVRKYPLPLAAGALALGYLIVPSRLEVISPDPDTLLNYARKNRLVIKEEPQGRPRGRILGPLFTLIASALVRGAMAYIGQQAGKSFGYQAASPDEMQPLRKPR